MAFPTTGILDNFDRANGAVGSNWGQDPFNTNAEIPQISSNQFASPTSRASFGCEGWWAPANYGPDSEAYFTIGALPAANSFMYAWARGQNPSTSANTMSCYEVEWELLAGTDQITIYRYDLNVSTILVQNVVNAANNLGAGDKLGIEVKGVGASVTITAYKNTGGVWTSLLTTTDSTANRILLPGNIGCGIFDGSTTTGRIDDFGGGPIAGPSYSPHRMPIA